MAINTEIRRAGLFRGNGTQRDFPFDFKVFEKDDLIVLVSTDNGVTEEVMSASAYNVALNADQDSSAGGVVRLTTPLDRGSTLAILSGVDYLQTMVLTNRGGFFPTVINDAFDKTTAQIQQIREMVARAVKAPATSTLTSEQFTKALFDARDTAVSASESAQGASAEASRQAQEASSARAVAKQSAQEAQAQAGHARDSADKAKASETSARETQERVNALIPRLDSADLKLQESEQSLQRKMEEVAGRMAESEASARESAETAISAKEGAQLAEKLAAESERVTRAASSSATMARDDALRFAERAERASTVVELGQAQADWGETRAKSKAFILNKPTEQIEYVKALQQNPPVFPEGLAPYLKSAEAEAKYATVALLNSKVSPLATKTEVRAKADKAVNDSEHSKINSDISALRTTVGKKADSFDLTKLLPTGTLISFVGKEIPSGFLLCNGATVKRSQYPALARLIGDIPEFRGDGTTTFTLPNLNGRVLEGTTDLSKVGSYVEAGLPNITGEIGRISETFGTYGWAKGAFEKKSVTAGNTPTTVDEGSTGWVNFSANFASNVYGNSSTVQPPAIFALHLIKF